MIQKVVLIAVVCALAQVAQSDNLSLLADFPPMIERCAQQVGASQDEQKVAFNSNLVPRTPAEKCLINCMYQNIGVIDSSGQEISNGLPNMVETLYRELPSYNTALTAARECTNVTPARQGQCELAASIRECVSNVNKKYKVKLSAYKPE